MSKHRIYIDQSGKVENTELKTVVAYSNDVAKSIEISSSEKRKLQRIFRDAGRPKMFAYHTFACLMYLLVKQDLKWIREIVVDREYAGQEALIKLYFLRLIIKGGYRFDPALITFAEIGKKNRAHVTCFFTYKGSLRPDFMVKSSDLLKWLL